MGYDIKNFILVSLQDAHALKRNRVNEYSCREKERSNLILSITY